MPLTLSPLPERLAICRLAADAQGPAWAREGAFASLTRTGDELSVVCEERLVPERVLRNDGWRALKVEGPLGFSVTGVLASLAAPLAEAGISLFAISTYDTDYVLVKDEALPRAVVALCRAGHEVRAG